MPLDPSFTGRTYRAEAPYEVGREKIREFADAIGDANPAYRDVEAAKALGHPDVIAPPTFPTVVAMRASAQVIFDPALGLDFSRVVHGEERYAYSRPIRAGDQLVTTLTIDQIRAAGGNDMLTLRTEVHTSDGEHVLTAYMTLVARGADA
jgi:acyl dehydratase